MNSPKYLVLRTQLVVWAVAIAIQPLCAQGFTTSRPGQSTSAAPRSAELAEAAELITQVVKLYSDRKYKEALPLAKRALEIREKALSADNQLVRNAQVNLAEVYIALGKYRDADPPLDRAIKSYSSANPDDVRLGTLLERKALVEYAMGSTRKAESAYQEALRIKEKAFGVGSPETAQTLLLLAEFYHFGGKDEKAAAVYQRLISVTEKGSSPEHIEQLVDAIARYVCVLGSLKREAESDIWQERLSKLQGADPFGTNPGVGSTNKQNFSKAGILNGKAISMPKPSYPEEARLARASGTVVVQVWIDERGNVLRACAISGPSQLRRTSEVAAYNSKFSPTKISGQPIKVTGVINYNYIRQ